MRQCERVWWPRVCCDECAMTASGVITKQSHLFRGSLLLRARGAGRSQEMAKSARRASNHFSKWHFRLCVSSPKLSDKSRLEKQRVIHKILKEELEGPVHALSIEVD